MAQSFAARIECVRDLSRVCRGISKFGSESFCFFVMEMGNEEGKKRTAKNNRQYYT